jgi:phosphatidylglycerophosphate synthase
MARIPREPLMSRAHYVQAWSGLHGGYSPRDRGLVDWYLRLMHVMARPFVRLGIGPDVVSVTAVVATAIAPLIIAVERTVPTLLAAAAIIAISGLLDGVDGAVAVMSRRVTRWGAVLDAICDRITEVLYLVVLWLLGAPIGLLACAGLATLLLEYTRARAGQAGMTQIGVVTIFERPTRIALAALTCVGIASLSLIPAPFDPAIISAWAWLALATASFVHLAVVVRRQLTS